MSENIRKLMDLEQKISKFVEEHDDLDNPDIDSLFDETHYVEKCLNVLKKASNDDVLDAIRRFEFIGLFVDYKKFLRKYRLNKRKINENPSLCLDEYYKLDEIASNIESISENHEEFLEYLHILDINSSRLYLLTKMPNIDLMILANNSNDWDIKLYYYGFLKKEN